MTQPRPSAPVIIRTHDESTQLVYLDTSPELAQIMGRYQPARYIGKRGAAYVLAQANLGTFADFLAHHGIELLDQRGQVDSSRPAGRDRPLPECGSCGQPAQRGALLRHCPACGARWQPIEPQDSSRPEALVVSCPACDGQQVAGMRYCQRCGHELPALQAQLVQLRRRQLQDPLPLGQALAELELRAP